MGVTIQLQFVKKIDTPAEHSFVFENPKTDWDYVNINDEFDLYVIHDGDVLNEMQKLVDNKEWPKGTLDFILKADGRCFAGDEGFENTIFNGDEILRFIELFKAKLKEDGKLKDGLRKYSTPDNKGFIHLDFEISEIEKRCIEAKEKNYYFKSLYR